MKADVLLGLQWGDEGKGKIVDVLTSKYDIVARFQGGPNAGHTLEFNDIKHILHTIPSGIFQGDKINVIGNGVVIDPIVFKKEIEGIRKLNIELQKNLFISKKAHLILPTHRILDAASEAAKGEAKIGSTLKGIGPAYMDKTGRNGLRVGDILADNFKKKYEFLIKKHLEILKQYDFNFDLSEYEKGWFEGIEMLKSYHIVNSEYFINKFLKEGYSLIAEGAQGTLLDIDFGSYPYVTSSNTVCAAACTGLGLAPHKIGEVLGVFKAYCTRVGGGPFPTELNDNTGEFLRKQGHEFGATTGRPRRCGWLDLPALKYSTMLNGVTQLIITKADVLTGLKTVKVCTGYKIKDEVIDYLPFNIDAKIEPVLKEFNGWDADISNISVYNNLPNEFKDYISYIEKEVEVPIKVISVGPNRKEVVYK